MEQVIQDLLTAIETNNFAGQAVFNAAVQTGELPIPEAVKRLEWELNELGFTYHGFSVSEPIADNRNRGTTITLLGVSKPYTDRESIGYLICDEQQRRDFIRQHERRRADNIGLYLARAA